MPLGRRPKRIDCAQLYALEIERLKMELDMMRMGLGAGGAMMTEADIRGAMDERDVQDADLDE